MLKRTDSFSPRAGVLFTLVETQAQSMPRGLNRRSPSSNTARAQRPKVAGAVDRIEPVVHIGRDDAMGCHRDDIELALIAWRPQQTRIIAAVEIAHWPLISPPRIERILGLGLG